MKKFLSAFLAILMVLSMVATSMVTVFAADAEEVHSILVSNGEDIAADQADGARSQGWRNHKINPSVQTIDGQKAAAIEVVVSPCTRTISGCTSLSTSRMPSNIREVISYKS